MLTDDAAAPATRDSCICAECQAYCKNKPGWFLPGEAERVAAYRGVTLEQLFASHLAADYWIRTEAKGGNILVLSPVVVGNSPGEMFPNSPLGCCVFYQQGRCGIHAVKPRECRVAFHADTPRQREQRNIHAAIARAWDKPEHQEQIIRLLESAGE